MTYTHTSICMSSAVYWVCLHELWW